MLLAIIVLVILGVVLLMARDRISDADGRTAAKWVGIAALVLAGVLLVIWLLTAVDSETSDEDLDAVLVGPSAWLATRLRRST